MFLLNNNKKSSGGGDGIWYFGLSKPGAETVCNGDLRDVQKHYLCWPELDERKSEVPLARKKKVQNNPNSGITSHKTNVNRIPGLNFFREKSILQV